MTTNAQLQEKMKAVKLLALDVDGVLTDGNITYSSDGMETKTFNIQDGLGIKLLQNTGVVLAIITGRRSAMVERRAQELGIEHLLSGREDKGVALAELANLTQLHTGQIAYMGDDLPDYAALQMSGLGVTTADAHPEIQKIADWVTPLSGGKGAVRQLCDAIMRAQGTYERQMKSFGIDR